MGLKNDPSDFNRIINIVIGRTPNTEVYFDDILIHSKTFEDQVGHVKEVLEKVRKAN